MTFAGLKEVLCIAMRRCHLSLIEESFSVLSAPMRQALQDGATDVPANGPLDT
jgi:hypothetical protein